MEVLAYLLADSSSLLLETDSHIKTRILFGGRKTVEGDEEHIRRFSNILLGLERGRCASALPIALATTLTYSVCRRNFQCFTQEPTIRVV